MGRVARGHRGAAKIKSKLCSVGGFDPDEWGFAAKTEMDEVEYLQSYGRKI
jgi:hypothetical protein